MIYFTLRLTNVDILCLDLKDELISHVDNLSDIKNRKQISACAYTASDMKNS